MWPFVRCPGAPLDPDRGHAPRRRKASLVASALALAAVLGSGTALADARTEARRHFKTGMALIAQKKLVEGLKELERAYEIFPHPNVAFNVAAAQAELGNYELAIGAFRTYLESNPPDRADVEKAIADLQAKIVARTEKEKAPPTPPPPVENPGEKPGDVKPGEKPADVKPGEKPGEVKPGEKPGEVKPPEVTPPDRETKARTEDIYQETVVTASRGAQSPLDSPNSTTIITKQDIRLSGQTRIPELLRRVAGMDVMQITGGDSNVSMRGFNSRLANKLLVLVDGRSVYNDILGSTFWETLTVDVDQIERIEVVRGPGSALYGADAFAGVVNIITIAPGEGKPGFRVGIGDHQQGYGSGWASGRDGDFAFRASVGYTRYPRWTREFAEGRRDVIASDFDQNLGAENLRFDLRMTERIDKNNLITFGGGFARVALNLYGIGPFNDFELKGNVMDVGADYKGKYVNAKAYFTRLDTSAGVNYTYVGHTLYPANPRENVFNAEVEYINDFNTGPLHHDIHAGLGYRLKNISWEYLEQPTAADPGSGTPVEHHGSAYVQDTIKIGEKVSIVGSGRADYVPYLKRLVGSPRGSVVIKPTTRQAVRLSGSTAFRTPSFLESYLALPIQLQLPGVELTSASKREDIKDFILQPEQITSAEASYLNQQSDFFEFEITAYYNRVANLIELAVNRNVTLAEKAAGLGGFDTTTGRYNAAYGGWNNSADVYNVVGGELGFRTYPTEGLDLFANYAINYTKQEHPALSTELDDQRTSHHKVNVGVQVRTKFGLNGEITFHYQSPQVWNEQIATATGIFYQQYQLPAYTLLNARLGFKFLKDHAEVSAVVYNALAEVAAIGDSDANHGLGPQMHPFGNRIGRRVMGFFSYSL
jgi:iron complex outermembrane receptor protein